MKDSDLILALDIGTSSLKTALFDAHGHRLLKTTSHQPYSLRLATDGAAELAVADLERAAVRALRATLRVRQQTRALKDRPIVAVSTSSFWHSLLGYNAQSGKPTPVYTWADSRCHDDALKLRSRLREKSYHARTGCMLRTPYWPAKLRWLARTGQARGITAWMSPAEWLYRRFTGTASVSLSMASGTGLLNLRTGDWDPSLLHLLKVRPEALGQISDQPFAACSNHPKKTKKHKIISFLELKDALWFPAIGDGAASNLGSDAVTPGIAALNVGTSAALRLASPTLPARLATGLFCHRIDPRRCLLGGAISNAGNLRQWALHQLRLPDDPATLERALAGRTLPVPGLTVLPFWTRERCPSWPDIVGGTITGITYSTAALDLLQAIVEASYHRLAQIADLLEEQSRHQLDIVVSGGIRHSPESLQRMANVLGRSIRPCAEPEASLRGAAIHALEQLGGKAHPLPRKATISPQPKASRLYQQSRKTQILLEASSRPLSQNWRHLSQPSGFSLAKGQCVGGAVTTQYFATDCKDPVPLRARLKSRTRIHPGADVPGRRGGFSE